MRYLNKVLSKAKKAPDKSEKRALTFSVIESEVVSRVNQAKLVYQSGCTNTMALPKKLMINGK